MITPDYARLMARYNAWQNRSLYREAATLSEAERREDRGAFFGSVHRHALPHPDRRQHLDVALRRMGHARRRGGDRSPDWVADWEDLCQRRVDDRRAPDRLGRRRWRPPILRAI